MVDAAVVAVVMAADAVDTAAVVVVAVDMAAVAGAAEIVVVATAAIAETAGNRSGSLSITLSIGATLIPAGR